MIGRTAALLLAGLAAGSVAAQELAIEELAPGVFAALAPPGHPGEAHAGFVLLEDGVLVVDTHMVPGAARELIARIRELTPLPVRYVVNTHWHPDHTHGNESYLSAYGRDVTLISHETTRADIPTLGQVLLERNQRRNALLRDVQLALPNLTFARALTLHDGGRQIQLLYFGRGHTRGDVVVYLPDDRVAFVGDLIGGGPPFARDGYPFAWKDTLEALAALDAGTLVAGHGPIVRGSRVVSDRLRFLEHALAVVRQGAARGWDAGRIAANIDLDSYRATFEPEPDHAPWSGWLRDLASRGLLELDAAGQ